MDSHLDVGPLRITEPATMLTDYLMAGLAVWFSADLGRRGRESAHARWWGLGFAFLAASALTGGTFHGLLGSLPSWAAATLWRATLATATLSSFATMRGAALQWLGSGPASLCTRVAIVKLAVFLMAGVFRPIFAIVVADFGLTMLFALGAGVAGRAGAPRAFSFLAMGVGLFAAGTFIQQARLSPHPHFNHNDLFHVIQIFGNACLFASARPGLSRQRERTRPEPSSARRAQS